MLGLGLLEKVIGFAIDFFVKNAEKRAKYRVNLQEFFQRSNRDNELSTELNEQYDGMRREPWKNKK